jgi:hypothetical protein
LSEERAGTADSEDEDSHRLETLSQPPAYRDSASRNARERR